MERNSDKVIETDFKGEGPRQTIWMALKDADKSQAVLIGSIDELGQPIVYFSKMTKEQMSLIIVKLQGYVIGHVNDWLEEKDEDATS